MKHSTTNDSSSLSELRKMVKQVWEAKTTDMKREIISKTLSLDYISSLSKGYRNDFHSNDPVKLDILASNILLKAEKLGCIGSSFKVGSK